MKWWATYLFGIGLGSFLAFMIAERPSLAFQSLSFVVVAAALGLWARFRRGHYK